MIIFRLSFILSSCVILALLYVLSWSLWLNAKKVVEDLTFPFSLFPCNLVIVVAVITDIEVIN